MGMLRVRSRVPVSVGRLLLLVGLVWVLTQSAVATADQPRVITPLPSSNYSVRRVCPQPARGGAVCLALQLVPVTPAARALTHPIGMARLANGGGKLCERPAWEGCLGLRPQDLHTAYDLPAATEASATQTVALVDAYDDPTAESDLKVFDEEMELPACTAENGCFTQVNQKGKPKPLPHANGEWAFEISIDIQAAHAICQNCRILLVEARSDRVKDLEKAEERAVAMGATEISNSWTVVGPSASGVEPAEPPADSPAFNHPGIVITAGAGDWGYLNASLQAAEHGPNYPASSPHVIAVAGTRLEITRSSGIWKSESVWAHDEAATGSGCSEHFTAPPWQQALADWSEVGCEAHRAVADIAADADTESGMAIYDSTLDEGKLLGWKAKHKAEKKAQIKEEKLEKKCAEKPSKCPVSASTALELRRFSLAVSTNIGKRATVRVKWHRHLVEQKRGHLSTTLAESKYVLSAFAHDYSCERRFVYLRRPTNEKLKCYRRR